MSTELGASDLTEHELDQAAASSILASEVEVELRLLHSAARAGSASGVQALAWDPGLTRLARSHAVTMAWQLDELTHRRRTLDERITHDWFSQLWRCATGAVGENLAWYQLPDAASAEPGPVASHLFEQWMDSSSHRTNVMNPTYDTIGVGVAVGPDGRYWAVAYLADFDQATDCPDGGVRLASAPSWSTPVAAGPRSEFVDLTITMASSGNDTADQAGFAVRLRTWARVVSASAASGDWNPSPNGRAGFWLAGDLDRRPSALRLRIEVPRGVPAANAIEDVVLTSDWGGATPLALN